MSRNEAASTTCCCRNGDFPALGLKLARWLRNFIECMECPSPVSCYQHCKFLRSWALQMEFGSSWDAFHFTGFPSSCPEIWVKAKPWGGLGLWDWAALSSFQLPLPPQLWKSWPLFSSSEMELRRKQGILSPRQIVDFLGSPKMLFNFITLVDKYVESIGTLKASGKWQFSYFILPNSIFCFSNLAPCCILQPNLVLRVQCYTQRFQVFGVLSNSSCSLCIS